VLFHVRKMWSVSTERGPWLLLSFRFWIIEGLKSNHPNKTSRSLCHIIRKAERVSSSPQAGCRHVESAAPLLTSSGSSRRLKRQMPVVRFE
jgi:hypothetical protein